MKTQIGRQIDPSTPLTSSPRGKLHRAVSWAGTCTSALCAVHCFGTAIIAILSPGLLKLVPHSEFAEMVVLGISFTTAFLSLKRVRARKTQWMLFTFFASIGLIGLLRDIHICLAISLSSLAILQLLVLWKQHHPAQKSCVPECCQHEQGHGH